MTDTETKSGIADMRETMDAAGLPIPPVPAELAASVGKVADWEWSSQPEVPVTLYNLRDSVETVLLGPQTDWFALSNEGHGVNSYGLQLVLSYRWLVIGLQVGWGGAYMDPARQSARFGEMCASLGDLLGAPAVREWTPPSGWRMAIFDSEWVEEKLAAWIGPAQATDDKIGVWWDVTSAQGISPLETAMLWTRNLASAPGLEGDERRSSAAHEPEKML